MRSDLPTLVISHWLWLFDQLTTSVTSISLLAYRERLQTLVGDLSIYSAWGNNLRVT